jgi:hypothetical protein
MWLRQFQVQLIVRDPKSALHHTSAKRIREIPPVLFLEGVSNCDQLMEVPLQLFLRKILPGTE